MKKIILYGSTGMLGSDCKEVLQKEFKLITPTHRDLDITRWDDIIEHMGKHRPHILLNCAAFTDVDACEDKSQYKRLDKINVEGPRNLAQGSIRYECKIIHISSDYIFSGKKEVPQPYFEDDPPKPISTYGMMKMESEAAIRDNAPDYIIIRTGWLYGINGNNFIKKILKKVIGEGAKSIRVVEDQYGSPTWTYRLALQIRELIKNDVRGTYNTTSEGYCSRIEYARFILDKLNIDVEIEPIKLRDLNLPAKRPANCILENRLLKKQGINIMTDWKRDLETFLLRYGERLIEEAKKE